MSKTVAVLCSNMGSNALGRALIIAELVERTGRECFVIGQGSTIWRPAMPAAVQLEVAGSIRRDPIATIGRIRKRLRGANVIVCKPRVDSLGVASVLGIDRDKSLLDIDDWELGFAQMGLPPGAGRYRSALAQGRIRSLMVAEHLEALAMSWPWKTASNRFLARRFAASMLPHVRDEVAFADVPARTAARARLGLDDRLWLGFIGTVRRHKGVGAAIEAIALSGRKDIGLLIAGAENAEATALKQQASTAGVQVVLVPPFARSELREVLASIDAVILPSEESSATRGQVPAKLFDAMAAGIGVIASDLDSHREALGATGMLFPPGNVEALAAVIAELTTERAAAVGQEARARFLERYSYRSAVPQFGRLLDAVFLGN